MTDETDEGSLRGLRAVTSRANERGRLLPRPAWVGVASERERESEREPDGATIARFSNVWKGYMEAPSTMLAMLR